MAETSKSEEMSAKLHLDVHKYIQAMQSQHGVIPHQDYSQYRQYCTRKLSRLRHNHDLIKTNGRALLHGSGGRGKSASVYQPRRYFNKNVPSKGVSIQYTNLNDDDTDEEEEEDREDYSLVNHVNFLLVMLVHAERCWSAAMHVKSQYDAFAASPPPLPQGSRKAKTSLGKLRKQYLSKLCKASYYASALYSMAKAVADESTVIECHAYSTWMAGNHALETLDWSKATREYGTCLKFINALSESFAVSSDLEMADYFTARGEYTIQPLFKFCQYELSQSRGASSQLDMNEFLTSESLDQNTSSLLQSKLAEKRNESRRAQVSQVDSKYGKISYRKVDFFIDNEELRVLLCKIDEAKENDQDDAGFTKLLSFYDDAIAIVSKDLQALEQLASGKQVNASKHVQKCLKGYLDFQKLSTLMTRNEQIVNDMENQEIIDNNNKRLEDLAHMYSVLLQNAKEVAALPLADEASPNSGEDLEDEFALEANAHFLRFRAWKNFYSAHVYSRVGKVSSPNLLSRSL